MDIPPGLGLGVPLLVGAVLGNQEKIPHLLRGPVFEKPHRASRRKQTDSSREQRGSARPLVVAKCPIRQGQVARIWLEGPAGKTNRQRDVTPDRVPNRSWCSNEPPQGQSWLPESGSHQSAKLVRTGEPPESPVRNAR